MTHKAFEATGERVLLRAGINQTLLKVPTIEEKLGIFWESDKFKTTLEGGRAAIDFIQPLYAVNQQIEQIAKGRVPRGRINPKNPILSLHCGIDHTELKYQGRKDGAHLFEGKLVYIVGYFVNDGNFEVYDKYRAALKKAGFSVE